MKVSLGPYLNWWGPYQIFGLLNHIGISKNRTDYWADKSPEWFTNFCQWIHDKRKRKTKIKIDEYDVWSMDTTLAIIILPMLIKLKEQKHGIPGNMTALTYTSNSSQHSFDFYEEGDSLSHETGSSQWDEIMDKMIWSFEQLQPDCDWEEQYWNTKPELDLSEYPEDEGKDIIPVRWKVEGDHDRSGYMNKKKKIDEGLLLFGKFFRSLWD